MSSLSNIILNISHLNIPFHDPMSHVLCICCFHSSVHHVVFPEMFCEGNTSTRPLLGACYLESLGVDLVSRYLVPDALDPRRQQLHQLLGLHVGVRPLAAAAGEGVTEGLLAPHRARPPVTLLRVALGGNSRYTLIEELLCPFQLYLRIIIIIIRT